ncbi:MAG TPA: CotH kinase family protein [Solirubrobacterales bacterium]
MKSGLASLSVAALLAVAAPSAEAETVEHMYSPQTVDVIELTLPPASKAALEEDPEGDYVEGTFALAETDGSPDGVGPASTPLTVGIRLKGDGSFQGLDGKAAFKLKFNEFVKKQAFLGLKKMTLNNMAQDPSMIHEALAYEVFRAAGIVAPRTGFASVRVNGEDYGIHLNLEAMDVVALERHHGGFEDPQHLYEGNYLADALQPSLGKFEVDEGDDEDLSDLEALAAAVEAEDPGPFLERMAPVADLDQMTRMWAVENYLAHWDGYAGLGGPNNFYLHSRPDGVFEMLPWGTDQTWEEPQLGFGHRGGVLFKRCLADQACLELYLAALKGVEATVAGLGLDGRATAMAELLRPWQQLEAEPRKLYGDEEIAAEVEATRAFISGRPASLAEWLEDGPQPEPEPEPEPAPLPDPALPRDPVVGPLPRFTGPIEIDRSRISRGVMISRVDVPAAGGVTQVASRVGKKEGAIACSARQVATGAGEVTIRCRLSGAVRRRIAAGRLRLSVSTRFDAGKGTPETLTRIVILARETG